LRHRLQRNSWLVLIGALVALSGVPTAAGAVVAAITVSPTSGTPGAHVKIVGTGFAATDSITVTLNGTSWLTATTDGSGGFTQTGTIPTAQPPGSASIVAADTHGHTAPATFLVATPLIAPGFDQTNANFNRFENQMTPGKVKVLVSDWQFPAATGSFVDILKSSFGVMPPDAMHRTYIGKFSEGCASGGGVCTATQKYGPLPASTTPIQLYSNGTTRLFATGSFGAESFLFSCTTAVCAANTTITTHLVVAAEPYGASQFSYAYVDSSGHSNFVMANSKTGATIWTATMSGNEPAFAIGKTALFASDGSETDAISLGNGSPIWRAAVGATDLMASGSTVFVADFSGVIFGLPAACATGGGSCTKPDCRSPASSLPFYGFAAGSGHLIASFGNSLRDYSFATCTGNTTWSTVGVHNFATGDVLSRPFIAHNGVYVVDGSSGGSHLDALLATPGATWASTTGPLIDAAKLTGSRNSVVNGYVMVYDPLTGHHFALGL
jgi:hypothetical protein